MMFKVFKKSRLFLTTFFASIISFIDTQYIMASSGRLGSDGSQLPFMNFLIDLRDTLTGPIAKIVGVFAIIFAAFGLFSGNAGEGFKKILWVIIGISLAIWAPTLVSFID